jgi:threonine dehydrogenase-like Zn-dependent dehydrogenase
MLAFRVHKGSLKAEVRPLPKVRRGWALVRVRQAGICNTDVEILRGYHSFRGIPGHEFVGEIVEVPGASEDVKQKWVGRRVAGEINIACAARGYSRLCEFCRRGIKTQCARRSVLGIMAQDGAFAEFLTLPLENLRVVPEPVSDEQAVFVEPLAAACQILEQVRVRDFGEAAVLGDGKLAQLIARVLRTEMGIVIMYGKHEEKLAMARRAGIKTHRMRGDENDAKRIAKTFSLLVEATGSPSGFSLAQQMTKPRGTLVLKSTFHGAAPVETWPIVVKEITVVGSRCGPFDRAIALLRAGKVDPAQLITRTFPLAAAKEAMEYAQKRGVMKVLLKP